MTGKIARMPVDAYLDTPNSVSLSHSLDRLITRRCRSARDDAERKTPEQNSRIAQTTKASEKNLSEKRISNPDTDEDHDDSSTAQVVQHLESKDRKDLLKPRPRLPMTKLPAC
jgi:hypothetical protein